MAETEQSILQLAECSKDPNEFISFLETIALPLDKKGDFFLKIGNTLFSRSFFVFALSSWIQALKYFVAVKNRLGESKCYSNIGVVYYSLNEFRQAIDAHQRALIIAEEIHDRLGESRCYNNLGTAYVHLGDFRRAIDNHQKALNIAKDIHDRLGESKCYNNLGTAYYGLGDFRQAIDNHQKALQIKVEIGDRPGESACYGNLGNAYAILEDFKQAIDSYQKSLNIAEELSDKLGELKCYDSLGNVFGSLADFGHAIDYHRKALEIAEEIHDKLGESICISNIGVEYENLGDFSQAIDNHQKALNIAKDIGDRAGESRCYGNLGNAYYGLEDYKKAIEMYEEALAIYKQTNEIDGERKVNFCLSRAYIKTNDRLAYDYGRRSIELSELIGEKLIEEQHIRGFQAKASDAFQLMVPLCVKMGKNEEAFEYVEGSKSRALLNLLAATEIKPTAKPTSEFKSLLDEEANYLANLRAIQLRHLKPTNVPVELDEVECILRQLDLIYQKISQIDPEYVSARRAKPPATRDIQDLLYSFKKPTILIEYFITKEQLFIFALSSKSIQNLFVSTVNISEQEIEKYFNNFNNEILTEEAIGINWLGLSEYLIKPISQLLVGHELVYFVPYGKLHYLPLHALELDGEPLIKKYSVAYAPSASFIKFCQNKGSGKIETCASFGVALKGQEKLERIVEDTSKGVADLFGAEAFNNERATKEKVLQEIGNKDVVHFSCHGYLNDKEPLSSGVVLYDENILSAKEIFNLKLKAEIISLGACQTGVSNRSRGDELVGLTRAFLYAGVPSLVVSLWSVNASSTKELMLEFYKQIKSGVDKATALKIAQNKIMNQPKYSHPHYWAPFILVGEVDSPSAV